LSRDAISDLGFWILDLSVPNPRSTIQNPKSLIIAMVADDWPAVRDIYRQGIDTGLATFETSVPDWPAWDAKHLSAPRLVARDGDRAVGFAALSRVSTREVYRGVCEVSIYVAADARGKGIGQLLMAELIRRSEEGGIWTLQASVFPENEASVALHLRNGFRIVGRRERISQLRGVWRDTLILERRSGIAGAS
jgi:phosphinothricin acetyltransferase